jgi:hypothetical protein
MEEILASIRRIIADDDAAKPAVKSEPAPAPKPAPPPPVAVAPPPAPEPPPPPVPEPDVAMNQADIDAMLGAGAEHDDTSTDEEPQAEILELTEAMATAESETAPGFRRIDANPDVVFSEDDEDEPPDAAATSAESLLRHFTEQPAASALLSDSTTRAVDSAFNTLAHTVLVQNARTLEDLVREMLRPMLKSWLDDNLPGMVERLVRAEIERVSRGRS